MLDIALSKGRLGDKAYRMLESVGFGCGEILDDDRKLVFVNPAGDVRCMLVKPADVPVYVARGVADVGVVGKDVLLDQQADVYELLDLRIGICRLAVAAREDYTEDRNRPLRVATKFVNITKDFYSARNREIELVRLHGSIELAPILGLSDVIVDIVESGKTLRENGLKVLEEIAPVSARLIANRAGYRFKHEKIDQLRKLLTEVLPNDENR